MPALSLSVMQEKREAAVSNELKVLWQAAIDDYFFRGRVIHLAKWKEVPPTPPGTYKEEKIYDDNNRRHDINSVNWANTDRVFF
jgi:hypothetical protein